MASPPRLLTSGMILLLFSLGSSLKKPSSLRIPKEAEQTAESGQRWHTPLSTLGGHLEEVLGEAGR